MEAKRITADFVERGVRRFRMANYCCQPPPRAL